MGKGQGEAAANVAREEAVAAVWVDPASLRPWAGNPRQNKAAVEPVALSIWRLGFGAPIIVRLADREVIAGHTRLLAYEFCARNVHDGKKWRARKVADGPFVARGAPGPALVPARFMDLSPEEAHALNLADNRLGELADWDDDALKKALTDLSEAGMGLDGLGWSTEDLDALLGESESDGTYTSKIKAPIYTPKGDQPPISALVDRSKTVALLAEIDRVELPPEQAAFLRLAAERHTAFNFHEIAEWYCHASPEVQRLMEDSGLVIIDFDRAIENGFVKLTNRLGELADREAEAPRDT